MDVNDGWVFLLSRTQVTLDSLGGSGDKLEVSMHLVREEKKCMGVNILKFTETFSKDDISKL